MSGSSTRARESEKTVWSVTIEAFGHVRTKRYYALTKAEAIELAKADAGFSVTAKPVVTSF